MIGLIIRIQLIIVVINMWLKSRWLFVISDCEKTDFSDISDIEYHTFTDI